MANDCARRKIEKKKKIKPAKKGKGLWGLEIGRHEEVNVSYVGNSTARS